MGGGDVEGLIEKAPGHRPPLKRTLEIGIQVCRGLEFAHSHGIVHRDLKPGNVWLTGAAGNWQQATGVGVPLSPAGEGQGRGESRAARQAWADADQPVAKLGDFGLAVALDRSRLTQAGMMVGTVAYMPPEQALGGEVTPGSDLYSLGAMLYEMVTGRPPFIGDESVAIITQHLNAAPVSPSWHNPAVPAALETLILRLLEKDPAKRPGSAAEVRAVLEGVLASARHPSLPASLPQGERGDGSPPSPLAGEGLGMRGENPMYRRAFVGREPELRQLQQAFDAATSGQGSLVMVVGEPGIGKTSLCEQLATYAAIRGGKTLVGHCYEEGSLSLPYLPFVEAMRSYVLARDPEGLKSDLGSGAGDIARIVSEVRDRLPALGLGHVSPSPLAEEGRARGHAEGAPHPQDPTAGPEEERYRLLQAVTSFLRNASAVQPLVIILEDLHDADRGTLDLLLHLSRNLAGARLLIAGTYRDVEVDRAHPLSATLAELRRSQNFLRIGLRGLSIDEVHRMMTVIRGQDVPWSRAEIIHRQTEGNPLFVQEVLRYLVEEGLVAREGGRYVRQDGGDAGAGIPEGLRDVIGKRLSRLSDKTNQVLAVASVIGRDFRLDVLQRVANLSEEELTAALEEATATTIIEDRPAAAMTPSFRFTHALFRQTLYEELFSLRRLRLHQQIARALEEVHARRLEEHAAELAEHFAQSTEREDVEKALRYSELAAERATAVYAYGEAVRHLERALQVQEVLDPDDKAKRCDLLLAFGDALGPAGETLRQLREVAPQAWGLAEAIGDGERAARACLLALQACHRYGMSAMYATPEGRQWLQRAQREVRPGTHERIEIDATVAGLRRMEGGLREARGILLQALELAESLDDRHALFRAAFQALLQDWLPEQQVDRLRIARQALRWPRQGDSDEDLSRALFFAGHALLSWGERSGAEAAWNELAELAARTKHPVPIHGALRSEVLLAGVDGRLEEAVALEARRAAWTSDRGLGVAGEVATWGSLRPLLSLGRAAAALTAHSAVGDRPPERGEVATHKAICLAHLGRENEARTAIRESLDELGFPQDDNGMRMDFLALLLEAAVLSGDLEALPGLVEQAERLGSAEFVEATGQTCIPRQLGAAAALVGDRKRAMRYYEQALTIAGKIRFRPEIALTRLAIAELMLETGTGAMNRAPTPGATSLSPAGEGHSEGDTPATGDRQAGRMPAPSDTRAAALAHLDFAVAEFREMKMQPALERALRHKDVLKA